MSDKITKNIGVEVDDSKIKSFSESLKGVRDILQDIAKEGTDDKFFKKGKKIEEQMKERLAIQKLTTKELYQQLKALDKENKQEERKKKMAKFKKEHPYLYGAGKAVDKKMDAIANKIVKFFSSVWSGMLSNLKEMISEKGVASYNMGTSLFTNMDLEQVKLMHQINQ